MLTVGPSSVRSDCFSRPQTIVSLLLSQFQNDTSSAYWRAIFKCKNWIWSVTKLMNLPLWSKTQIPQSSTAEKTHVYVEPWAPLVVKQHSKQSGNPVCSSWVTQTSNWRPKGTTRVESKNSLHWCFVFFTSARAISFCVPAYISLQHPSPLAPLVWHRGTPAVAPHLLWR